ncbi:UNVERIFIED_ORG: hypothetical protein ABIC43_001413 [Variovorax guangxiensis]
MSLCAAILVLMLILGLWYPSPFDVLSGGRQLLMMIVAIDVVCGPLLTAVVFSPKKRKKELWRDLCVVVLLQILALSYGVITAFEARPVWVAFEGDRFRVVSVPDIDYSNLEKAPRELRRLSVSGPKPLGVKLLNSGDTGFLESIQLSLAGIHPSFRPERWINYDEQIGLVLKSIRPLKELYEKNIENKKIIDVELAKIKLHPEQLGYLPLVSSNSDDWIVWIDRRSAIPQAFVHVNPW